MKGLGDTTIELNKKKKEEQMIAKPLEEEEEEPFYDEKHRIYLHLLEYEKNELDRRIRNGEPVAEIKRVKLGDGTTETKLVVHNSLRFKFAIKKFAKNTGLLTYNKAKKTWELNLSKADDPQVALFKVMNFLRKYVNDVYIMRELYEELYKSIETISIPPPNMKEKKGNDLGEALYNKIKDTKEEDKKKEIEEGTHVTTIAKKDLHPTPTQDIIKASEVAKNNMKTLPAGMNATARVKNEETATLRMVKDGEISKEIVEKLQQSGVTADKDGVMVFYGNKEEVERLKEKLNDYEIIKATVVPPEEVKKNIESDMEHGDEVEL